ncbi:MAG: A24 family peptidase [Henriciella sp.]
MIHETSSLFHQFGLAVTALLVWSAAVHDLRTKTIPNIYPAGVFALATIFAIYGVMHGFTLWELSLRVLGMGLAFSLGVVAFSTGIMGGGDVKLFTALAPIIPFYELWLFFSLIAISGMVLAILMAALEYSGKRLQGTSHAVSAAHTRKLEIAYGPAIALGLSIYLVF